MSRSGSAIAAILVASIPVVSILVVSCAAAEPPSSPGALPPALSQYAPLSVSSLSTFGENVIESQVHRELLKLPFFGVFDHLAFTVDGSTVVLRGQVLQPSLKDDAAEVVANITGVDRVANLITFLPDSPADNAIRLAVFTAIYGHPSMSIYATGGGGAIHVVVQDGRVWLEGQVGSNADAHRAADLASARHGVVSVTNHLTTGR
jgi:hyperosmotically inducible periplasmic protein